MTSEIRIVFAEPPGPLSFSFVEVENDQGESITAGEWRHRPDGLYELVIKPTVFNQPADDEHRFYLVWKRNGRNPRHRHKTYASAVKEAIRLTAHDSKFYVLTALAKVTKDSVIEYPVPNAKPLPSEHEQLALKYIETATKAGWAHGGDNGGFWYDGKAFESWKAAASSDDAPTYATAEELCKSEGLEIE